jgi:hypothetical protein
MTLTVIAAAPIDRPGAFPEHVRERAFQIWAADGRRSPARTARILGEHLGAMDGAIDHPPEPDTIRKWATRHDWPAQARAAMADNPTARYVLGETVAEYLLAQRTAVRQLHDLVALDVEDEGNRRVIIDAVRALNECGKGLREWGTTPPDIPSSTEKRETIQRSRDEVSAEQLARIQRMKQAQKGKH